MIDRSDSLLQQVKVTFGRNATRFILLLGDLGSAAIIGWCVQKILPSMPATNHVFQIWFFAMVLMWLFTYDIDKNFRLDFYLTYTRVLKIACWAALGYLLFFVTTREFYSLRYLVLVTLLWIVVATTLRWLLGKFSPPLRGLAFDLLPEILKVQEKIVWQIASEPKKVNLSQFDFLLIDFTKQYSTAGQELLTHAHIAGLPILSLPQVIEHLTGKVSIEHFNDYWIETTFYIDPFYLRLKRFLDIAITILLSPLLVFLLAIISILIFIFMGKPIFFWQQRMGLDDKPFKMVKFRTMVIDAEKQGSRSTSKDDERVTPLGMWLRKLRLDELPQFYNVLKGEMSIVGPRPEAAVLVENFVKNIPLFQTRHWLRPGITGWAQVRHGYASSQDEMMEKMRHDMFYLKNISLWLDLIIIFRTVVTVITGFGSR